MTVPAPLALVDDGEPARRHVLHDGDVLIGRGAAADLRLDATAVSRLHARVRVRGEQVEVEDLDSHNGTVVNGRAVTGRTALHVGDRLQIGPVVLRLDSGGEATPPGGETAGVSFGVGSQSGGHIWNVGGDVHQSTTVVTDEPWDELFQGTPLGRLVMAVGLVAAMAGFGLFVHFVFTGFFPPAGVDPFGWNPFTDGPRVLGVPQPLLGFALFAGGGLLAGLGSGMSRAGRRRRGEAVRPVNTHVPRRRR